MTLRPSGDYLAQAYVFGLESSRGRRHYIRSYGCSPNVGAPASNPQFAFGYGLTYRSRVHVGQLDETPGPAAGCP